MREERVPYLVFNCIILRHGGQVLDGVVFSQTILSVLTQNLDPSSVSLFCIPRKTRNNLNHAKNFYTPQSNLVEEYKAEGGENFGYLNFFGHPPLPGWVPASPCKMLVFQGGL